MKTHSKISFGALSCAAVLLALAIFEVRATLPTLPEFGYETLRINGRLALGSRPLLVVLIDAEGSGLEFPADHNRDYYLSNTFDLFGAQSLNGFLLENSNGRFSFSRTGHPGVIGPIDLPAAERFPPTLERAGGNERLADLLFHSNLVARTMLSGQANFAQFNTDANPDITGDELHMLFIFNEAGTGGATRSPGRVQPPGFSYALDIGTDSGVSFPTPFDTTAHELTHTLGGFDLYGSSCFSSGLTLMSCTSATPDGRQTFHLDPWHKLKLGWCEPRVRSLRSSGAEDIFAAQMMRSDAQIILYDPARGANEYFILEYRTRTSPAGPGYDRDVSGDGLVIWHIKQGVAPPGLPGVFTEGAPLLARGGSGVWSSGTTTPYLTWADGVSSGTRLYVHPFDTGVGSITVEWWSEADRLLLPPPAGPGHALRLDGVDDYLTATPSALPAGNAHYTIEAWIKPESMQVGCVVAWGSYAPSQVNAFVIAPEGLVNYWWANDLTAPTPSLAGTWHHVAATFDGTTRRIILDGVVVGSDQPSSPPNFSPVNFRIGLANAGQYFHGQIDEVRVWNVARTPAEIQETMLHPLWGNEPGLIAYWRLDDGSGATAMAATGNPADRATMVGDPVWTLSTITLFAPRVPSPNGPGHALRLDGVDDYLTATPPALPAGNACYTIEAWIKPESMQVGCVVAWGSYAPSQVNAFVIAPEGLVNYWWANDLTAPTPSLAGTWHHVAATFDGTTRRIILDGVVVGSDQPSSPPNFSPVNFRIGLANAGQYFHGQIDEVRVWNVARTPAEIQETMGRQLWGSEPGLVGYWRFDEGTGPKAYGTASYTQDAILANGPNWVTSSLLPFAPDVDGGLEAILSPSSVRLVGTANANNSPTLVWFEWGQDFTYGNSTPTVDFGGGSDPDFWRLTLENLIPGTTYHARAVGTNAQGASYSRDFFWTLPVTPPRLAIREDVPINGTNTVILSWFNPSTDYVLQQTVDLTAPGGGWTDVMQRPIVNGTNQEVTLPAIGQIGLFRLRWP